MDGLRLSIRSARTVPVVCLVAMLLHFVMDSVNVGRSRKSTNAFIVPALLI